MTRFSIIRIKFLFAFVVFFIAFLFSLSSGTSEVGLRDIVQLIFAPAENDVFKNIFFEFRLPKTLTAIIAGSALSVSGLLMQTLFRNPLAGPYVLGITGGANLFVAMLLMGATTAGISQSSHYAIVGMPLAAAIGALVALLFIVLIAGRVRTSATLLLAGIMLGFIYGAIQNILEFFADPGDIKRFAVWSMGSLGEVRSSELPLFLVFILTGIVPAFLLAKQLDLFLLGDEHAQSLGLKLSQFRWITVIITALMTGVIVAYCGPIAFVGLAVPHLSRIVWKTNMHRILIPASVVCGATLLLICDGIGNLFSNQFLLPINIVTSLFGAPFVLFLLFKNKKID